MDETQRIPIAPDGTRRRPNCIDLFCGGGGAGTGLAWAGFDVTGVDINDQPEYPFRFIKGSALEADLTDADFIWASPQCHAFTSIIPAHVRERYGHAWGHENLIPPIRERLEASGKKYIIENVPGAASELKSPVVLCGTMFPTLRVFRHRLFESNFDLSVGMRCNHSNRSLGQRSPKLNHSAGLLEDKSIDPAVSYVATMAPGEWRAEVVVRRLGKSAGTTDTYYYSSEGTRYRSIREIQRAKGCVVMIRDGNNTKSAQPEYAHDPLLQPTNGPDIQMFPVYGSPGRVRGTVEQWGEAMNIDWIKNPKALAQAIPPAYSEYLGRQALSALGYTVDYPPRGY